MKDVEFTGYLLRMWKYATGLGKNSEMSDISPIEQNAFVTVATDDNYALGALVLGNSLRSVKTKHKLVILITSDVSTRTRAKLSEVFDDVHIVDLMESNDEENLSLMSRLELGKTFTKLHIWKLTNYSKCVFLDADTLVLKNCDELFERTELSAVPDVGWPDCFNSGVFVFEPSIVTYQKLLTMAVETGSFDGGDQGLLNSYFSDWRSKDIMNHLSFIYNMVTCASYTYLPAYKQYGHQVKIIHFLGNAKPWHHRTCLEEGNPCDSCRDTMEHLLIWWNIYQEHVAGMFKEEQEISEILREVVISSEVPESSGTPDSEVPSQSRQQAWEQGQIDYLGCDSFENIKQKLEAAINQPAK